MGRVKEDGTSALGGLVSDADIYHNGVKGMKWGSRKARLPGGSSVQQSLKELQSQNKAAAKQRQRNDVDLARRRRNDGTNKKKLSEAKALYARDKGSLAAKKALVKAKNEVAADVKKSMEFRDGKEEFGLLVAGTAFVVAANVLLRR